jgi:PKD repeat protein
VLLLASCGGAGDSVAPPPPPVAPASLSLAAGDGQSGAPSAAVAIKPSVRVRDAQGRPLQGVAVAFTVEAGGGSVQQASATTGADGTASPGDWTLGPSEGENRLRASVGSLPPLLITAQGVFQQVRLADTTIGAGGGTITYHKAGDPLDGLELTIPARAYPGASHWSITARPVQSAPTLRFGQAAGAVLEISGDQDAYADSLLVLRIPYARDTSSFAMAFAYDRATGRLEALPLAAETATTLTVVTRHFNPAFLAGRPGPAAAPGAGPAAVVVGGLTVLIVKATHVSMAVSFASGFTPGVDDWEFPNKGSYTEPDGACSGQSVSAIWYYLRQKQAGGPQLYERFGDPTLRSIWPDDPQGYRFASWTHRLVDDTKMDQGLRQMAAIGQQSGVPVDRLYFYSLALAFAVTGDPYLVVLDELNSQGIFLSGHAVVAYASERTKIWVADPNFPGQQRGIVFLNDKLGPYTSKPNANAGDTFYNRISFIGISAVVPVRQLDAAWPAVMGGTIGDTLFPDYRIEYRDSLTNTWRQLNNPLLFGDTLTTYLGDLPIRIICPSCAGQLPGGPAHQQPTWLVDQSGNDIGTYLSTAVNGVSVPLPMGQKHFFAAVHGLPFASGPQAQEPGYIDFRRIDVVSVKFTVTPAQTFAPSGTTVDFVAPPMGKAPPGAHYRWDFGDGSAILDQVSDSTASHKYTTDGFYLPKVTLANGRKLAEATANVQIGATLRIDPNPASTPVNTPLTLTARNLATGAPAPMRYVWDFGDNTTLQRDGDSTAQHSWAAAGSYTVTVSMKDPVTQVERGRGSGQVQVEFALSQVSVGGYHACGLTAAGAAWCWGRNQFGQVGDGTSSTTAHRLRPVPVTGGHLFSRISAGLEHSCGVTPTGELWCWGRNQWGRLGLGTVDNVPHPQPTQVPGLPPIASVSAGLEYTCALDVTGQAWCWGRADDGQLGEGTVGDNVQRSSPVRVLGALTFAQLSAGSERTCGVTGPGLAYCWGYNGGPHNNSTGTYPSGVLGVGSIASFVPQPAQVSGSTLWAQVSAGTGFSCGRTTAGTLRCWGINGYAPDEFYAGRGGQLGDGTALPSTQPVPTATGTLTFTGVGTAYVSACALSAIGEAWCWGTNAAGEVGDGGPTSVPASSHYPTPIKVVGGHVFASLSVGFASACGTTSAGETWCWGGNLFGALGNGTTGNSSGPVRVSP